jgi:bla regulator protein BlaR1
VNSSILIGLAAHLWQSTLFIAVAGGLTLLLRSNSARVRYALWLAASAKFLLPFALLNALGSGIPWLLPAAHRTSPFFISTAGQMAVQITRLGEGRVAALVQAAGASNWGDALPIAFATFWVLGTVVVVARWLARWLLIRQALRESTPTRLPFIIPVRTSSSQLEPGVVGVLRPVLLIPEGMEERLTPEEMSALLAHERCHVAWHDNMAAVVHMLVEAIFWFHPLVWWLGKRLVEERERGCDESVLGAGHVPESYAEGILKVCEHCLESRLPCVAGVTGANLRRRVEDIMKNRRIRPLTCARKLLITAAACATIAVPVAFGVLGSPPRAQSAAPGAGRPGYRNVSIRLGPAEAGQSVRLSRGPHEEQLVLLLPSLRRLIAWAYGVAEEQVEGGDWSRQPAYSITVDDSGEETVEASQRLAMLQDLLAQHFGLVIRRKQKQMDGYVLLIGPRGPKLAPHPKSRASRHLLWVSRNSGIQGTNSPLSGLVSYLQVVLHAPVVDQTGLQGNYDFRGTWAHDPAAAMKGIQEQLGLRLEARPVTAEVIEVVRLKSPQEIVTRRAGAS